MLKSFIQKAKKGVVELEDKNFNMLQNFYGWHYMWSKFYHFKK